MMKITFTGVEELELYVKLFIKATWCQRNFKAHNGHYSLEDAKTDALSALVRVFSKEDKSNEALVPQNTLFKEFLSYVVFNVQGEDRVVTLDADTGAYFISDIALENTSLWWNGDRATLQFLVEVGVMEALTNHLKNFLD